MIRPVNNHVLIEPIPHDSFIATQKETYEEIGIVKDIDVGASSYSLALLGKKVYFDSWLVSKFPKGDGTFYWFVPFENIKAYEDNEPLPE